MKFVVVSDSHGLESELELLMLRHSDADGFIHCGDSELPAYKLTGFSAVIGNNDYFYNELPEHLVITIGSKKALIIHSHRQSYVHRHHDLYKLALENGCDYVFYGHTHAYDDTMVNHVRMMNPGSLFLSRDRRGKTYALFEISEDGEATFTLLNY